jgi:hypothetical protein
MRNFITFPAGVVCLSIAAHAQSTFGVVVGTVKDPSGAAVSGATVKLTNTGENIAPQTLSSSDGTYEFQMGRSVDAIIGEWSISSMTNAPNRGTQRPDRIGKRSLANHTADLRARPQRICLSRPHHRCEPVQRQRRRGASRPRPPLGRFGNSGAGRIEGPGTFSWNAGPAKRIALREAVSMKLEGRFTSVTNRVNLGDPQLNIVTNSFGRITSSRGVHFGGGLTGQVSMRLEF